MEIIFITFSNINAFIANKIFGDNRSVHIYHTVCKNNLDREFIEQDSGFRSGTNKGRIIVLITCSTLYTEL